MLIKPLMVFCRIHWSQVCILYHIEALLSSYFSVNGTVQMFAAFIAIVSMVIYVIGHAVFLWSSV